jgi:hypothetical protein
MTDHNQKVTVPKHPDWDVTTHKHTDPTASVSIDFEGAHTTLEVVRTADAIWIFANILMADGEWGDRLLTRVIPLVESIGDCAVCGQRVYLLRDHCESHAAELFTEEGTFTCPKSYPGHVLSPEDAGIRWNYEDEIADRTPDLDFVNGMTFPEKSPEELAKIDAVLRGGR